MSNLVCQIVNSPSWILPRRFSCDAGYLTESVNTSKTKTTLKVICSECVTSLSYSFWNLKIKTMSTLYKSSCRYGRNSCREEHFRTLSDIKLRLYYKNASISHPDTYIDAGCSERVHYFHQCKGQRQESGSFGRYVPQLGRGGGWRSRHKPQLFLFDLEAFKTRKNTIFQFQCFILSRGYQR